MGRRAPRGLETTAAQIEDAKAKLRRDRDVVSLRVRRVAEVIEFTAPSRQSMQKAQQLNA